VIEGDEMFRIRLLSGIVLVILLLLTMIPGGQILWGALLIISLIGFHELTRVFMKNQINALSITGLLAITLYYLWINPWIHSHITTLVFYPQLHVVGTIVLMLLFLMSLLTIMVLAYPMISFEQVLVTFFAVFYVAVMMSFVFLTRELPHGVFLVWLVFICSWGCDTAAYCAGMTLGKHKLAPVLSPKKSVEGAIGGVLGAALIGFLYALAVNHWGNAELSIISFAIIGGIGAVISQIGDLSASAIKRFHDIKDYGTLIPGHGGILDRFDSVIFTAPMIYLLIVILL